ncbi:MAG: hypothetical protein ACK41T_02865 [Pseudobdellovibrio sp.]
MKLYLNILTTMLLGLTLSGCGGSGAGQPLNATNGAFVMGSMKAQLAANMPTSNNVPALPVGGITTNSISARSAQGCGDSSPASPVDMDNDNIALYKKYNYDCSGFVDSGYSYKQKGFVEIRDLNDNPGAENEGVFGGMRVDFDMPLYEWTNLASGTTYTNSHLGHWEYKKVGSSLVSDVNYTGKRKYGYNGFENDYTFNYTWKFVMTPDSASDAWGKGKIEMTGSYELNGKYIFEYESTNERAQKEGKYVINYKTTNLTYDDTCSKYYKTGTYEMTDGTNKMELVYSCTDVKFYVNGQESDWW